MKSYPLLEPAQSSEPDRFIKEFDFWSLVDRSRSLLTPRGGFFDWAVTRAQADLEAISKVLYPYFQNIPVADFHNSLLALNAALEIRRILKEWKETKKPVRWDSSDQSAVITFYRENRGKENATKLFREEARRWGENTAQFLIYDGIRLSLEGNAKLGAVKLLKFESAYQPTDHKLRRLLLFSAAKALAGAGEFREANQRYSNLAKDQGKIERAETIREQCSLTSQLALTWPTNKKHQEDLERYLVSCKRALGRKATGSDHERFTKVEASLREFEGIVYFLKTPSSFWQCDAIKKRLEEIRHAVVDLMAVDKTTGRNRHTHLAALYLRSEKPEIAIQCLSTVREQIESKMEKGLSWLVEGQALGLLGGKSNHEKQVYAFWKAEELIATMPGDKFRRVARALRVAADPHTSRFEKLGIWAGNMLGDNRIVGSFVVRLPKV